MHPQHFGLTSLIDRRARPVLLSLALLFLAGCGFRLQGALELPVSVSVIDVQAVDAQSEFTHALAEQLRRAGAQVRISTQATVGAARLNIEVDEFLERVASVSARNVPREYELTYRVRYSFTAADPRLASGMSGIESEELTLSREFSFDERIALAKQRERAQLRTALANELAGMVVQRLASLK